MRNRTGLLIGALVVVALLAVGGTVGALALTHSGLMGNGYRMMSRQQTYPTMMNGKPGYQGMMGGQYSHGSMMSGYRQNAAQQGTPVAGVTQMNMQHGAYQVAHMQVRAGTTVTWTNQDSVPHSITFMNGMRGSGLLSQGQSFSYMFKTPGTYQYYCTVHPNMVATVTVVS